MSGDFEVAVVGGGIAGCVTAYRLARAGRQVVLIERGETPGAKSLSGGVLYPATLLETFPDLLSEAPIERRVTRHVLQLLNAESSVALDYSDARLDGNAVTVLRARFDAWLAARCEDAGVTVLPGVRVDGVLRREGRVVGVRAGDDDLSASVVVAADGVHSFVSKDAGLRPEREPTRHLGLGVKAVLRLDERVLADRFGLVGDAGAAYSIVGDCTGGVPGGGFLYTNRESMSVGLVLRLDALVARGLGSAEAFERFLAHPFVAPLLAGAELVEYGAHLVSEGGISGVSQLVGDGIVVVGDAAGLTLNTGLTIRGMDLAAASGGLAARAIDGALAAGDVSATGLDAYRRDVLAGPIGHDLRTYRRAPAFLGRQRLYGAHGRLVAEALRGVFEHDGGARRPLRGLVREAFGRSGMRARDLIGDAIEGVRAL